MGKEWWMGYRGNRWIGRRAGRWRPMGPDQFRLLTRDRVYVMRSLPFRGIYVSETWVRTVGTLRPESAYVERRGVPNVKKVKVADRGSVKNLAPLETEYFREHMGIVEHLALLSYEDGTPRQPGYLGIWVQGSTWVVRITDKDADATLTAEGRTLDEALDTLQLLLGSESAPWEPNSRRKRKGG